MIRSDVPDVACFGRLHMVNTDLPERFAKNWPLNREPENDMFLFYKEIKEDEKMQELPN